MNLGSVPQLEQRRWLSLLFKQIAGPDLTMAASSLATVVTLSEILQTEVGP